VTGSAASIRSAETQKRRPTLQSARCLHFFNPILSSIGVPWPLPALNAAHFNIYKGISGSGSANVDAKEGGGKATDLA
jgi:hypothetical protein